MEIDSISNLFEKTLVLSPHFDDETIGCGGTIHRLIRNNCKVKVVEFAVCNNSYCNAGRSVTDDEREIEFKNALAELSLSVNKVEYCRVRDKIKTTPFDGSLDQVSKKEYVTFLDKLIDDYKPTAVLFPYPSHNQDHNLVNEVAIAALRPVISTNYIKIKAMYEYPPNQYYKGQFGEPNLFIELDESDVLAKQKALKNYSTQLIRDQRDMLDLSVIMDMSRTRGKVISKYNAEAFYLMIGSL